MKPRLPADPERWQRIEALFDEALDLPAGERGAFLDEACAGDPELRAQVEAMLAADGAADGFLGATLQEQAASVLLAPQEKGLELGPYRLVREIGSGGMGVVYEAEDVRLRRRVAVKLLPPEYGRDPTTKERFLREARAASALDDPNICTVHDIGESDGRLYLVMAYYEGETLRERLRRGPLPVEEAHRAAVQVARALARAHEAGIVHRDVKPANVMLTRRGEVKILDFGIAKIWGDTALTRTGSSLGTPFYMSPEQARGEEVDARTDLWSLGALLYEMLSGRRPFAGENEQAVFHGILSREPEPLDRLCPEVPAALARTVARTLSKDRATRYRSAAELLGDLESGRPPAAPPFRRPRAAALAAGLLAAGLLAAGGWWASRQPTGQSAAEAAVPIVPMVGVVAFANRTGDPGLDWYGGAIARLVMDSLSPSRHLQVASETRTAVLAAAGSPAELSRRAAGAGIGALLTGEILRTPRGLLVAARLQETEGGRVLAGRRIDGLAPERLLLASEGIAMAARKGLGVPPSEAVGGLAADFLARNPEAYGDYVRGLSALLRFRYPEAEQAFAAALAKAPGFTMARYRLALVQYVTSRTDEALVNIRQAVSEAERLPDREARYVRAGEALFDRRAGEAAAAYRQLVERYPHETEAGYLLAQTLMSQRRYEEALPVLDILGRLEPDNPLARSMAGESHLALRRFDEAVAALREALELHPADAYARYTLGRVYQALGELDLAVGELEETLRREPGYHFAALALAEVDVLRGRQDFAGQRLRALAADPGALPRHRISAAFDLASIYRSQGRFREAEASLAALREEIAAERVREAPALMVRGLSKLESGDLEGARRLLDTAVETAADHRGRRLCALFTRGLLELRQERWEALEETVRQIRGSAAPPGDPDRGEEKAAAFLQGMRGLESGQVGEAVEDLSRAVALKGTECALHRLGLARAYLSAGRLPEALAAARTATDPGDLRLDLEPDRVRALLVLARVQESLGLRQEAVASARQFLDRWARADPGLAELLEARRLAGLGGAQASGL
ncbi:MAG TPA: protein kinase [Thermoanaerobaculia bacterium]|nr:protein kinase [Thermoanaerobaculia bacterium]